MSPESRHERFSVPDEAEDERLDHYLVGRMPNFSRSSIQRLIREGYVRIDGFPQTKSGRRLRAGEAIEVEVPPPVPAEPHPQSIDLDVVYEDDDLIVLNKPAGIVVHPAAGNLEGTLVNALLHHCKGLSGIGGIERPGIVHRLDKMTSGLMAVAKNDAAHRHLAGQLADRTMKRIYVAVVWGEPQPPEGTIDAAVGRDPHDRKRMAVVKKGGRRAVTRYKTLQTIGGLSFLELSLETGRTHQIRVHLTHIGCPVVGDTQYGPQSRKAINRRGDLPADLLGAATEARRQLLHARSLRFAHPVSGEILEFGAPLPDDIAGLIDALKAT